MNRDLSKFFEPPKAEPDGLTKELFGRKCPSKASKKETKMSKELVEIVRCKNCIHRPIKGEDIHDIDSPKDSRGYEDYTCPCLCDDYWYSWYPSDEWFCANGEAKSGVCEHDKNKVLDKIDEIITDALDKSTDQKESQTLRWVLDKISEVEDGNYTTNTGSN